MGVLLALLVAASPSIAVLDVRTGAGVDPSLGPYLAQVLAQEVEAYTHAAPLVSADVTAMLGFERNKRMLGCSEEDSQCLAEITGALGVQQVLATSLAVAGGKYLVSMSLLDARRGRSLKRFAETVALDNDPLVQAVRRGAAEIFGTRSAVPEAAAPAPQGFKGPSRRTWALIAGGGAVALAATGAVVGIVALSAANRGDPVARPRAHLADILYGTALLAGGAATYLWFTSRPAAAAAGPIPGGAAATVAVAW
jgi:hypothetical protein